MFLTTALMHSCSYALRMLCSGVVETLGRKTFDGAGAVCLSLVSSCIMHLKHPRCKILKNLFVHLPFSRT